MTPNARLIAPTLRAFALALVLLVVGTRSAIAQQYRFQVTELDLEVFIQHDGSAKIDYTLVFSNKGKAIDIVDVGLPHRDYNTQTMTASINDHPLSVIRQSKYIDVGVEVPLSGRHIQSGSKGTFKFSAIMPDMVYQDTTDKDYASLQIIPTWFDPDLQVGTTRVRVAIHMPPGIKAEEVRYQDESNRYQNLAMWGQGDKTHVVASWEKAAVRLGPKQPKYSVSFPKRTMTHVVSMNAFTLAYRWFENSPGARFVSRALMAILFVIAYFRFTNGTGIAIGIILGLALAVCIPLPASAHLWLWPTVIGVVVLMEYQLRRGSTKTYTRAMATAEGGGIKRGLAAPQAAIVLETEMGKVIAMVLFGLLKKGVLELTDEDPLAVRVKRDYLASARDRRDIAGNRGIVLRGYEHDFIDALSHHSGPVAKCNLTESVRTLVYATSRAMRGFDLSDTQDYYRHIVDRAWREASSLGVVEREATVDRNIDWLLMSDDFGDRMARWERGGFHYRPSWGGSSYRTGSSGSGSPSTSVPTSVDSQTSLGEVASSFAGWAENSAGNLAGMIEPANLGIDSPGGTIDLTGVDTATQNFFQSLGESGGGGGGGGGGCACACAGCACACACAGGGR